MPDLVAARRRRPSRPGRRPGGRFLGLAPVPVAAVLGSLLAAKPASAQEVPRGHLGMATVVRRNLGAFADRYGMGYLWGFVAGYSVTRPDDPVSIGIQWVTLFGRSQLWETLGDDDPAIAGGALQYFELGIGLRLRYAPLEVVPGFLVASAGGALLRNNVPIPPGDKRVHGGGFLGLGTEYFLGKVLLGLDGRYGLVGDAPRSVSVMFWAAVGR